MAEEKKPVDYQSVIHRARKKRKRPPYFEYLIAAVIAAVVILAVALAGVFGSRIWKAGAADRESRRESRAAEESIARESEAQSLAEAESESAALAESESAAEAESAAAAEQEEKITEVLNSYANLGFVQVSGYLNIRKNPEAGAGVVGKLLENSACEILDDQAEGWYQISSGGVEGYVSSEYVLTGDEAKEAAREFVKNRAVITADSLNIRSEASVTADIVGQCLEGERYEILSDQTEGWYQIDGGYISSDYAEERLCLNEARKLDLKAMVLNYYDHPGVSNVSGYLNIREGAGENEKIIAKLPSYAGCEILETLDGWYKIRSGNITGYVSAQYILTGDAARQAAMEHAELVAVVSADRLNARTEPSTDAKVWTQISNNERYHVVSQTDGWVQIELDEGGEGDDGDEVTTAYVSSEFVDVRYGLQEAIKFSPAEENASLRSRIVSYAMQFLGNPYVWGGTSLTKGADCSGFTMSVMKHFGISLPHYSGDQAKRGTAIKSSQMKPGDLIFYGNSRGRINHVAMYIGNGQIIHAASRRSGIKISTWNYRSPVKIVNVIGN